MDLGGEWGSEDLKKKGVEDLKSRFTFVESTTVPAIMPSKVIPGKLPKYPTLYWELYPLQQPGGTELSACIL